MRGGRFARVAAAAVLGFAAVAAFSPGPAVAAGTAPAWAPVDSARSARRAIVDAQQALAAGDSVRALAAVERAAAAWPAQWQYARSMVRLAARLGDTARVRNGLARLAALGVDGALADDAPVIELAARDAVVRRALDRLASFGRPLARSVVAATLGDSLLWPEAVACDSLTGRCFVTSVRQRKVVAVDAAGEEHDFATAQRGLLAAMGVRVDGPRRLLWVTSAGLPAMADFAPADSGRGAVHAFDLPSGELLESYVLPPTPEGHVPGDLCVSRAGDVYVSDSAHPAVYRIAGEAGGGGRAPEVFVEHPLLASPQGLCLSRDETTLYLADYAHGLLAIDLATRAVRALAPPPGATLVGIDGLLRHGEDLIAVQNGVVPPRVVRLRLAPDGARVGSLAVIDRHLPPADEPTNGDVVGDDLVYVANSAWEKFDDTGALRPGAAPARPVLLRLPLARGAP